jgi:hypothetical protein
VRPIGAWFQAGVAALQWVVDSYNLVYALLLLTGGLLADLYGRRLVFMAGAVVFTAASLVCAVAPSIPVLIGARALAGVGAALLLPASLAIIRVVWGDTARARQGAWHLGRLQRARDGHRPSDRRRPDRPLRLAQHLPRRGAARPRGAGPGGADDSRKLGPAGS